MFPSRQRFAGHGLRHNLLAFLLFKLPLLFLKRSLLFFELSALFVQLKLLKSKTPRQDNIIHPRAILMF